MTVLILTAEMTGGYGFLLVPILENTVGTVNLDFCTGNPAALIWLHFWGARVFRAAGFSHSRDVVVPVTS